MKKTEKLVTIDEREKNIIDVIGIFRRQYAADVAAEFIKWAGKEGYQYHPPLNNFRHPNQSGTLSAEWLYERFANSKK